MKPAPDPAVVAALAWQPAFAALLLDAQAPLQDGLFRPGPGAAPALRLAVYRNNVVASLSRALAEAFPVVVELVGAEFFAAMARCHVAVCPPRSPVLVEYGEDFAAWIERFAPAAGLPYLADVARLERARQRATHAAEATPLSAAALGERLAAVLQQAGGPERLAASRPRLHPSLAIVRSRHAVVSLWAAHQGRGRVEEVDLALAESALVLRQGGAEFAVVVLSLPDTGARWVQALLAGATLAAATAAAQQDEPTFDPAAPLALLIAQGGVVDWPLPDGRGEDTR